MINFLSSIQKAFVGAATGGVARAAASTSANAAKETSSKTNENSLADCSLEEGGTASVDTSGKSLEQLESMRNETKSNKAASEDKLATIAADGGEVGTLKGNMDKAYEEYQQAMNNEAESNPEVATLKAEQDRIKEETDTNNSELSKTSSEITTKDNEISEQKNTISGFKSEVSSLESQLAAVPANSTEEGSEEKNAELDAKRKQIQDLLNFKKEELSLANQKLERLEEEKEKLQTKKDELETKKQELIDSEKEVQEKIEKTCSETVKLAQEAYNTAKDEYETTKSQLQTAAQTEVQQYAKELETIESEIVKAKNKNREETGNYKLDGGDVVLLAKQYEGLSNDEMRAKIEETGTQFDDGNWCADFVTSMMKKTYGSEDTPDDFANTCSLYCNCDAVAEWGSERGRTTEDSSEVQAGDAIIVRTASGGSHIGFVDSVNEDGTINTIEGNTAGDDGIYSDELQGVVNKRKRHPDEVKVYVRFNK